MSSFSVTRRAHLRNWLLRASVGAVASGLLLTAWAPGALAAPLPLTVQLHLGDTCVSGTARKNSFVKVVVRDPAGNVKLRDVGGTGSYGDWQVCSYEFPIMAGDRVRVHVYETGETRKFTVPKLTVDSDRVSEVVSGKAPHGSALVIEVSDYGASYVGLPEYDFLADVVAAGNDTYSHDFSGDGIDLIAGTRVFVVWQMAGGAVQVVRESTVAGLQVNVGDAQFLGSFKPNAHLGIVVTHNSNQVATGDAVADAYYGGSIQGQFVDGDTEPYAIREGDVISAPGLGSDGTFAVPAINGAADLSTEHVSGKCYANGLYVVQVIGPNFEYGFAYDWAGANGNFNVDLSGQLNIKKGFSVQIVCYTANADAVVESFTTS